MHWAPSRCQAGAQRPSAGDFAAWEGVRGIMGWRVGGQDKHRVVREQRLQRRGPLREEDDTHNDTQVLEEGRWTPIAVWQLEHRA